MRIIQEICNLRPNTITSRATRAVQRQINNILERCRDEYAALSETDKWMVACACQYARGEIGRGKTAMQAVDALTCT
jgi:hypothetical protein